MWYIILYFDGIYVDGFMVPTATDEWDAIRRLKSSIIHGNIILKMKIEKYGDPGGHSKRDLTRNMDYLRSLKRPWRIVKGRNSNNVQVVKVERPVVTGAWINDILTNAHVRNIMPIKSYEGWEQTTQ